MITLLSLAKRQAAKSMKSCEDINCLIKSSDKNVNILYQITEMIGKGVKLLKTNRICTTLWQDYLALIRQ